MIPQIGLVELTLVLVLVAMLFGVGKLPEVFGSVGKGLREFRKEASVTESKPGAALQNESEDKTKS